MPKFADIIIDITHEQLDKSFQYIIPKELETLVYPGVEVKVPFGKSNRTVNGYVIGLSDRASFDVCRLKSIISVVEKSTSIEGQMITLAAWIKDKCGSTMIQALKTVLPVKKKITEKKKRTIILNISSNELDKVIAEQEQKNNVARLRLLRELKLENEIDYDLAVNKLNLSPQTIRALIEKNILRVDSQIISRNPSLSVDYSKNIIQLNEQQLQVVENIDYDNDFDTFLIHGITGSGKTEVYIELIARTIVQGKQAIMLIPEIALTYQTVKRFNKRFGDRVSIINSKLSQGERYDQYEKARNGQIDIIIGPRSALFTPFNNLGIIIIDEEHEQSYKSENTPRYHARDVAIARAKMCGAKVVLGSATPSVDSYYKCIRGEYKLLSLNKRATGSSLANVEVIDLRDELKSGNKSIISFRLKDLIQDRLDKKEQIMLFINRRGYESFVSCRSCGTPVKCPHCDVALTEHYGSKLVCHYCGYTEKYIKKCKKCGSPYVAGFKAGTQKIESVIHNMFPTAKTLRMDADTTSKKGGHERILTAFSNGEADILIGTQMIVKGHDFANVTLVGILAADLSLYSSNYMSAERTFQLLTQAAGRAGRGALPGDVIIQTYSPDNYAIESAANQDYLSFYNQEIAFRQIMNYPPVLPMLLIIISATIEEQAIKAGNKIKKLLDNNHYLNYTGPADAPISKIKDQYKKVLYIKATKYDILVEIKDNIETLRKNDICFREVGIIYDFNPLNII